VALIVNLGTNNTSTSVSPAATNDASLDSPPSAQSENQSPQLKPAPESETPPKPQDAQEANHSKWLRLSNTAYTLNPSEDRKVLLLAGNDANTNQVMITILDLENKLCKEDGTSSDLGEVGTYKVSDTYIKFHGICINGNEVEKPFSNEGESFIVGLVDKGDSIVIDMGAGNEFHYDVGGFAAIRKSLEDTKNAL
jgi:hypothetical protein